MTAPGFHQYARGKLLLSGEYFVLDGALALALPAKFGQHFSVTPQPGTPGTLQWNSLDQKGNSWFSAEFRVQPAVEILDCSDLDVARGVLRLLQGSVNGQTTTGKCLAVETRLEFPRNWGLGSSSTLVAAVSSWLQQDPYALLKHSFGGSGYDIACAFAEGPLSYRLASAGREIEPVRLNWDFKDQLLFVHLGKKQNSRQGIARFRAADPSEKEERSRQISRITEELILTEDLDTFCRLIDLHEDIISQHIGMQTVQAACFPDHYGSIKSLGAWGGDFVLAACRDKSAAIEYFRKCGRDTILEWHQMIVE